MPRILLATDSLDPSGMGEHMLALGRALDKQWDVTLALLSGERSPFLTRALRHGLSVKRLSSKDDFATWLGGKPFDLLHVHAGIGWEGIGLPLRE